MRDVLVDFAAAARRRVEHVFKPRKSLAAGIAGLGQQFPRQRRIVTEPSAAKCNWPSIGGTRCDAGCFAGPRDFFDDAFLVNRQRERLADARVVKRFSRHVEADEIGAEIIERVKIGTFEQHVQQFRRARASLSQTMSAWPFS